MPELVYIASPYTSPYESVMATRYVEACKATAFLMKEGKQVFSPIVHSHVLAKSYGLPNTWQFWEKPSFVMLDRCDALYVLKIGGRDASVGVKAEIERTERLHIPVWD